MVHKTKSYLALNKYTQNYIFSTEYYIKNTKLFYND